MILVRNIWIGPKIVSLDVIRLKEEPQLNKLVLLL